MVPVTLAVIFILLYLLFRSIHDAALVMAAVPFSLIGGFWLVWALGHSISVAAVGFIFASDALLTEVRPFRTEDGRQARQL